MTLPSIGARVTSSSEFFSSFNTCDESKKHFSLRISNLNDGFMCAEKTRSRALTQRLRKLPEGSTTFLSGKKITDGNGSMNFLGSFSCLEVKDTCSSPYEMYSTLNSRFSPTSTQSSYRPVEMTEVIPDNLYIGSEENATNEHIMREAGITHAVSVCDHVGQLRGIEYMRHIMNDRGQTQLSSVLKEVYPFMENAEKLFVHCKWGQNRSATLIIAFLMKSKGMTLKNAYGFLKMKRPIVQINRDYAKQLLELEKEIFGNNTMPECWMERGGFDKRGVPIYECEVVTPCEQSIIRLNESVLKSSGCHFRYPQL